MKTLLLILLLLDVYVLIYFRLMVRYYYQCQYQTKESAFWALLSPPPYRRLDKKGKAYARRYLAAVAAMAAILVALSFSVKFVGGTLQNTVG